jgi:osmotically inducible protein OsmC
MALSSQLSTAGTPPERSSTTATLTIEKTDAGFTVTGIHLDVTAKVPGSDAANFSIYANTAKTNCPISRLLNTNITMEAKLEE